MKAWQRYKPDEVVYRGRQQVTRKYFRSEDGGTFDFETVGFNGKNAATVVAITSSGQAIVAKQFRVGPEAIMWECPSGAIEDGEGLEDAATRELLEETGYQAQSMVYLGSAYDSPYSSMERNFFLAENCEQISQPQPDDLERIEVELVSISRLIENAKSGKMTNGLAVLFAYDRLIELEGINEKTN